MEAILMVWHDSSKAPAAPEKQKKKRFGTLGKKSKPKPDADDPTDGEMTEYMDMTEITNDHSEDSNSSFEEDDIDQSIRSSILEAEPVRSAPEKLSIPALPVSVDGSLLLQGEAPAEIHLKAKYSASGKLFVQIIECQNLPPKVKSK
jgi:hypothetical protein